MLPTSGRSRTSVCALSWIPFRMSGNVAVATLPAGTPIRTSTESAAPEAPGTDPDGPWGRRRRAGRESLCQEAVVFGRVESMKTGVEGALHFAAAARRKVV